MIKKTNKRKHIEISIILLTILFSCLHSASIISINNKIDNSGKSIKDDMIPIKPFSSSIGEDEWWNTNFEYRTLLQITNPGSDNFINHLGVSVNFNYSKLVSEGKMNSSLKDLRIVENDKLRKYYIQKDYPVVGNATVWFQCNVSAGATDYDTYMYYGNNSINFDYNYLYSYNPMGVSWWRFDEGSGNDVSDSIDGITRTVINGATWATGKVGSNCLDFIHTSGNWINVGDLQKYKITGNQTIAMWIAPDSLYDRQNPIGKAYGGEGTITLEPSGSLSYYYGQGGGNLNPYQGFGSGSGTVQTGSWQHVAIVRDLKNNRLTWYKNGIVINTAAALYNPAFVSTLPFTIGDNYVNYFDGRIDDLRVYNAALSWQEMQWLAAFNYSIGASLLQEHEQGAQVDIIVRDVDGRPVPNAVVFLHNQTGIIQNQTSNDKGEAVFSIIPYGLYNVSVNYSLSLGSEVTVYDSKDKGEILEFSGLRETKALYVNLTTIDFEIDDYDGVPMNLGLVNISLTPGGGIIETLPLDSNGKATFRWLNGLTYYYKAYYDNIDYFQQYTFLNGSSVQRKGLYIESTILANLTAQALGNNFLINEIVYANDSSAILIGKVRIVEADIKIRDMTDYMTSISIYNVDEEGYYGTGNLIYNKIYSGNEKNDDIKLNVIDNSSAYGLRIVIQGYNPLHNSNGTIFMNFTQTTHQLIQVNMSKITIKVVDQSGGNPPVPGVFVHIFNGTAVDSNSVVNLTTNSYGYAYDSTNNLSFWYLHDKYNFSLEFFSAFKIFDVIYTNPGQWNATATTVYNYSLNQASEIIFELTIDTSLYMTSFSYYEGDLEVIWGENINYQVNFTYTTDNITWYSLTNPDSVTCSVYKWGIIPQLLYSKAMTNQGSGNFSIIINSSFFSAGYDKQEYIVKITGSKNGYSRPFPIYFPLTINTINTQVSLHNWSNVAQTLTEVSQYYNELINVTVSYYLFGNSNSRLHGATLSYNWDYGSGFNIGEDPINPGYYSFEINTSLTPTTGTYSIDISIELENYTRSNFAILMNIIPRFTTLNDTSTLYYVSAEGWIHDAFNLTLEYKDVTGGANIRVGDLELAYYYWYQLADDGTPLGSPSSNIDLIENEDKLYILDFDTETRDIGKYAIFVTLQKNNYEAKNAFINIEIKKRTIDHLISATGLSGSRINVIQGENIIITLDLKDESRNMAELTGATVSLTLASSQYSFVELGNGMYQLVFPTEDINAFFLPQTLLGTIEISKEDFVTENIPITIVIGMTEIFPGFPMFYFLMILGAIVAVVGSLVAYRMIQQAKIPKFVKKARAMKKEIKGRKSISESLLYPSKDEYIVKKFGDKWNMVGLSLENILGLDDKKRKKLPESTEPKGGAE